LKKRKARATDSTVQKFRVGIRKRRGNDRMSKLEKAMAKLTKRSKGVVLVVSQSPKALTPNTGL
jgi:hypothetical protein